MGPDQRSPGGAIGAGHLGAEGHRPAIGQPSARLSEGGIMGVRLGYLLPTREQVMAGQFEARSLLDLASRAAVLGFHATGRPFLPRAPAS